jgi:hypothetical protein
VQNQRAKAERQSEEGEGKEGGSGKSHGGALGANQKDLLQWHGEECGEQWRGSLEKDQEETWECSQEASQEEERSRQGGADGEQQGCQAKGGRAQEK